MIKVLLVLTFGILAVASVSYWPLSIPTFFKGIFTSLVLGALLLYIFNWAFGTKTANWG